MTNERRSALDISLDYRSLSERYLYRLYTLYPNEPKPVGSKTNASRAPVADDEILLVLTGVGLSLWRAVFLIPGSSRGKTDNRPDVLTRGREMLEILVDLVLPQRVGPPL